MKQAKFVLSLSLFEFGNYFIFFSSCSFFDHLPCSLPRKNSGDGVSTCPRSGPALLGVAEALSDPGVADRDIASTHMCRGPDNRLCPSWGNDFQPQRSAAYWILGEYCNHNYSAKGKQMANIKHIRCQTWSLIHIAKTCPFTRNNVLHCPSSIRKTWSFT